MIWTILVFVCVLATKFITSVRLRGLRAKLEAGQPLLEDLRTKVTQAEEEAAQLRSQLEEKKELVAALRDAVRGLEETIRQGRTGTDLEAEERLEISKATQTENVVT